MGRFLNPDNSAFQVALNSEIYVDKTGLLEYTNRVMGTKQGYICNSRPRRFGKSITADMLTAYYSRGCSSREMFEKLNIGKSTDFLEHLNRYDVIHLDIQWFLATVDSVDEVINFITDSVLVELRESYPDVLPEEPFSMLVSNIDYNSFVGRTAVGKIEKGSVKVGQEVAVCDWHDSSVSRKGKITAIYTFEGTNKVPVDSASAGDIIVI